MERHKLVALSFFLATWVPLRNWIQALNKALERLSGVVWPFPGPSGIPRFHIHFICAWQRHQFILCAIRVLLLSHTHKHTRARLKFPIWSVLFLFPFLAPRRPTFGHWENAPALAMATIDWAPNGFECVPSISHSKLFKFMTAIDRWTSQSGN